MSVNVSDHGSWSEDLPAYLLGALEPGRAAELERHLEGCERCRAEARWLTPAVATLPESVPRLLSASLGVARVEQRPRSTGETAPMVATGVEAQKHPATAPFRPGTTAHVEPGVGGPPGGRCATAAPPSLRGAA